MPITVHCSHCGAPTKKTAGEVNRARKAGMRLFCGKTCFGLDRRTGKTKEQKIAEKRLYDMRYRKKNRDRLRFKKRAYFERTYDPIKAARERKKRMPEHIAYCRQPRYKAYKREYDQKRRDSEYGPFAEAKRLTIELNREIKIRMTNHEIRSQNQTLNKRQSRSRASPETPSSDRHSSS